ncbi:MAG: MATE family efflux transporter [Gammaproteobacteria bacterium]|nr:MATE family efflux transporter [Gammaproteobacteria bacterium]
MNLQTSSSIRSWLGEARAVATLAAPLALTHLSYMAIMLTDVVMMGWIGTEALAAGSLARDFYWVLGAFAMGVLTGATPIMAQHLGARRSRHIRPVVRNTAWLALLLTIPISIAAWWSGPILVLLGQEPFIAYYGQSYLRYLLWGLLPSLLFAVLTEFLAAHTRPRAVYVVSIVGIALNALLDYTLMFGNFGAPNMGLEGAGVASLVVNWFMFLVLLCFVLNDRQFRCYRLLGRLWKIQWSGMAEVVRIGSPIAVTELAEMGLFFVTTLMMGLLSVDALAAHAVTAQCYALVFMIPVGLAQAGAVRVGRSAGARDSIGVTRAGWTATALAGITMLLPAVVFWFGGRWVAGLILDPGIPANTEALGLAVLLLGVAAFFMIADAVQITVRGVLQGLKDTAMPMVIAVSMSWGIGIPTAVVLGFFLNLGGPGIWAGMAVAMTGSSWLLIRRFRQQEGRFMAPL